MTDPMTAPIDEARLREATGRVERWIANGMPDTSDHTPHRERMKQDLRMVLDALSAERAVSQRWHDAYSIAHDQATENGQRASAEREEHEEAEETIEACQRLIAQHWETITAERERGDRAVGALSGLLAFIGQMTSEQFIAALYDLKTPGLELCDRKSLVANLDAAQSEAWSALATQKAEGAPDAS